MKVVQYPPLVDQSGIAPSVQKIRAAFPVKSNEQWRPMRDGALWLLSTGGTLIAGTCCAFVGEPSGSLSGYAAPAGGGSISFYYYTWPHPNTYARLWTFSLVSSNGGMANGGAGLPVGGTARGTITLSYLDSGQNKSFPFEIDASSWGGVKLLTYVEQHHATDPEYVAVTLASLSTSTINVQVAAIACYEIPRVYVTGFGNVNAGDPIADPTMAALGLVMLDGDDPDASVRNYPRRSCLFSWAHPIGITISSTSFTGVANVLRDPPAVLARRLRESSTVESVVVVIFSEGDGEARVTAESGDVVTFTLGASAGFYQLDIEIDTEDYTQTTTDGGLRDGDRDFLTIEVRKTGGGDVEVRGIYVGEGELLG